MEKILLLRYDVECDDKDDMKDFLGRIIKIHKENQIPATLFFTGHFLETRSDWVKTFHKEVEGCPLFDIQNHSYSHVGVGYETGKPIEVLESDYKKSFAIHEDIFGTKPTAVSLCGTGGEDGNRLKGFDTTPKTRAEFDMLVKLGIKIVNSFLNKYDESKDFMNYGDLGHSEIMGFPSDFSDTEWLWNKEYSSAVEYILEVIRHRGKHNEHVPLILHDWVQWTCAAGRNFEHIKMIADTARNEGFTMLTVSQCFKKRELWV